MNDALQRAATELAARFGSGRLCAVADGIVAGKSAQAIAAAVAVSGFAEAVRTLLAACDGEPPTEAGAYLRGVAAGYASRAEEVRVESVWSGPSTHRVPLRATAQVLVDLVAEAERELLLVTYAARPYPPLLTALSAARDRGVAISVLVETLQGAGSALAGSEPAAAFATVPGIQLWHWHLGQRGTPGAKMHAKLAVADRRVLLVSSANLTQSGIGKNIEAGVLVHGGSAPFRAAEHIEQLRAQQVLARL